MRHRKERCAAKSLCARAVCGAHTAFQANALLADHLFSPSLLLAERIERALIPLHNKTGACLIYHHNLRVSNWLCLPVIELGAGCALPSLVASTLAQPPRLVTITDYPDATILDNLSKNVHRNRDKVASGCTVVHLGYEWGQDVGPLL